MRHVLLFFIGVLSLTLNAQTFVEVSIGQGYSKQTYYALSNDAKTSLDDVSWDIAFSAFGVQDAAIYVNESAASNFQTPAAEVELYRTLLTDFTQPLDATNLGERVYNNELSWNYGAGNEGRVATNPLDYGWGAYAPMQNAVIGNKIFVIQLRNGSKKRFMVTKLDGTVYKLRIANEDGSNETTVDLNKTSFSDKFIFFSFTNNQALTTNIGTWDMLFQRYATPLDDGMGNILEYSVTGVLTAPGIQVAKATAVAPEDAFYSVYKDSLVTKIDGIGHDWKYFDFANGWIVEDQFTYFVRQASGQVYKINFVDFEGTATGNIVFSKEDLGIVSTVDINNSALKVSLFPNPASDIVNVLFDVEEKANWTGVVTNALGQQVQQWKYTSSVGLNAIEIPVSNLPAGTYFLHMNNGETGLTQSFIVR